MEDVQEELEMKWIWSTVGKVVFCLILVLAIGWQIMPPVQAQGREALMFPSGHWVDDTYGFLSYWREHNGETLLGAPVTRPMEEHGLFVQYFERGRLELHTELEGSPVLPGRVGADYAAELWLSFTFEAPPLRAPKPGNTFFSDDALIPAPGEMIFDNGFTIKEPFTSFWKQHNGLQSFGYPISQPLWEYVDDNLLMVQYFERTRLERHSTGQDGYDVRISSLGRDLALLRGYDMTPPKPGDLPIIPVAQAQVVPTITPPPTPSSTPLPTLEPTIAPPTATPIPPSVASTGGGGSKYIVVNLSTQWLYAYEGDVQVLNAPVSTGRDGFNTPVGTFSVYAKYPSQTMSGNLGGEYYYVPNVPHVMYIYGGVALHGTYWHNQFGTGMRMSHGCINLPQDSAAWLYNWTPMGTPVHVRY